MSHTEARVTNHRDQPEASESLNATQTQSHTYQTAGETLLPAPDQTTYSPLHHLKPECPKVQGDVQATRPDPEWRPAIVMRRIASSGLLITQTPSRTLISKTRNRCDTVIPNTTTSTLLLLLQTDCPTEVTTAPLRQCRCIRSSSTLLPLLPMLQTTSKPQTPMQV